MATNIVTRIARRVGQPELPLERAAAPRFEIADVLARVNAAIAARAA